MHRALVLAVLSTVPIFAPSLPRAGTQSTVTIVTSDKVKLEGTYFSPKRDHAPAVLLIHDAGAERSQLAEIGISLQKRGFGVLSIDLRGHGESKSKKTDWERLDERARALLWQLAPRDVEAAAAWLVGRKEIHSTNLSLLGYRAGCALVARHAEDDMNVKSMLLLAPKSNELGFDVASTLGSVSGLPTCVLDHPKPETVRMVAAANGSSPWIELLAPPVAKSKLTVLDDSKTPRRVTSWLWNEVMPKKGR